MFVYYPIAKDEAQLSIREYETDRKISNGWDRFQGVVRILVTFWKYLY